MEIPKYAMIPATQIKTVEIAIKGMKMLFSCLNMKNSTIMATRKEMGKKIALSRFMN
jgi:hypothetical protein